ncbi:gametocyte-specific factor 1-like isoform X6 [Lepidochelys kempii]|uniref:gametocyte-specific factor 1-like isoform X5 n=1 Tax=Lepidochelys kempii TaxID=8472 RepID=UPI003C6F21C4
MPPARFASPPRGPVTSSLPPARNKVLHTDHEPQVDALDPERLIQCPYDKYHQIRACRFPYHLIKCRKNHPEIAKQLATCPFNARHQVPRAEISRHISSCDDKSFIEEHIVSQSNNCQGEKMNIVSMWQPPPCDEDWDRDLQEQSNSAFVWGTFSSGVNR